MVLIERTTGAAVCAGEVFDAIREAVAVKVPGVAGVAEPVVVDVQLVLICDRWAIVAGVAQAVSILVELVGVGDEQAVVGPGYDRPAAVRV